MMKKEIKSTKNEPKGCGKALSNSFFPHHKCGDIEDLKHSDNVLLCPECKEESKCVDDSQENKNVNKSLSTRYLSDNGVHNNKTPDTILAKGEKNG